MAIHNVVYNSTEQQLEATLKHQNDCADAINSDLTKINKFYIDLYVDLPADINGLMSFRLG